MTEVVGQIAGRNMAQSSVAGWAVIGVAVAACVAVPWVTFSGSVSQLAFPVDDAAITLANARALLTGADPVHVGVSPFYGATSTVHLFLTTAALGLIGEPRVAGFAVQMLSIVLYVMALGRLADRGGHNGIWVVLVGLGAAMMPFQLNNGLETVLACAAIAYVLGSLCGPELGNPRLTGIVAAALPFIRPELGLLGGMVMLAVVPGAWRTRGAERECVYAFLASAAGMALVLLALSIPLVPSTVAAKRHFFVALWDPIGVLIVLFFFSFMALPVLVMDIIMFPPGKIRTVALGWAVLHVVVLVISVERSAMANAGRYYSVLAPAAACMMAVTPKLGQWRSAAAMVILTAPILMLTSFYGDMMQVGRTVWRDAARFVATGVADGERVLAHDIGEMSLYAGKPVVDGVGLKTPWVAAMMAAKNPDRSESGQAAGVLAVVETARPDWIVAIENRPRWRAFVEAAEALGATTQVRRSFGCDQVSARTLCMRAWRVTWPEASAQAR